MNKHRNSILTLGVACSLGWAGLAAAQSTGDQVKDLFEQAKNDTDAYTTELIEVTEGVIDAAQTCEETFEAIKTATSLMPQQAPAIVSTLSLKKNCNCNDGGIWMEQRLFESLLPGQDYPAIDAEPSYSCTQVSIRAGITGLPENADWETATGDEAKRQVVLRMAQAVHDVLYETLKLQSKYDWECGGVDIDIAAAMQGIPNEEFRKAVYGELASLFLADDDLGCGAAVAAYLSQYPDSPLIIHRLRARKGIGQDDLASPN